MRKYHTKTDVVIGQNASKTVSDSTHTSNVTVNNNLPPIYPPLFNEQTNAKLEERDIELSNIENETTNQNQSEITVNNNTAYPAPMFNPSVYQATRSYSGLAPPVTTRNINTSRSPIITREDIENNANFHKLRADILTREMGSNSADKRLALNLLDRSEKVILKMDDLIALIAEALNVNRTSIAITYEDLFADCGCTCSKKLMYKNIINIKLDGLSLASVQNEAYNAFSDVYGLSIENVFI